MPTQKISNNKEEGRELRKNAIFFLMAVIIVAFFMWVGGSALLYCGTGWRRASISFLSTSVNAGTYFSLMMSVVAYLNLTLTTVLVSGYARKASSDQERRVLMATWSIFALANMALAMVAWIPLHMNYHWHWTFGIVALYFYTGGICVMSRIIGGDIGGAMIKILVAAVFISGGGWVITRGIVFPEIVVLVVVLTLHYLMLVGLYSDMECPMIICNVHKDDV